MEVQSNPIQSNLVREGGGGGGGGGGGDRLDIHMYGFPSICTSTIHDRLKEWILCIFFFFFGRYM